MKKVFLIALAALILSLTALARTQSFEKSYAQNGETVFASFNGTKAFFADSASPEQVDDACYWLGERAEMYNIKFVSFIGDMSSGANYMYKHIIQEQGLTHDDLWLANDNDTEWKNDFKAFKQTASLLTQMNLAYGVSIGIDDYYGKGYDRRNHIQTVFEIEDFIGETGYQYELLDINNFAVIIRSGTSSFIVYQLEAFPRAATLSWFDAMQTKHSDKRAIVFTTSMTDANGDLYTQHDWSVTDWLSIYLNYNSTLTTNLLHNDKPHDGVNLWNNSFAKWNNLLCVVTSNAKVGTKIVTSTLKNNYGNEVLAVVANLSDGYGLSDKAFPLLISVSEDHRTIDLRYADPYSDAYEADTQKSVILKSIGELPPPDPVTLLPKVALQGAGSNKAYINGYDGNLFKPNANMTRAEACTIIARLLTGSQTIPDGYTTRFTDVSREQWYYNAIAYLDELGYFYTNTTETYRPDENITRAEFAELAYFASELTTAQSMSFKDVNSSNRYYSAILAASAAGLVNGYEDGTFRPNNSITRAEVVTIINRLIGLVANENTVYKEKLATVFSDITGHWGEYQILMASNNNVNSKYYYEADLTSLYEEKDGIGFETDYIKVTIDKKGKVSAVINKMTDEDIKAVSTTPWFCYLISSSGAEISPTKAEIEGGRLKLTFKDSSTAYLIIETKSDHFNVTLDTALPTTVNGAVICNIRIDAPWALDDENAFGISSIPMTTTVDNQNYPGGSSKTARGVVYTYLGVSTVGAKVGVAFSRMTEHREHLKSIMAEIDPTEGLVNTHGGPYTYDHTDIFGDYVILWDGLTSEIAADTAKLAKKYGISQIDFIQNSWNNFITADFNFICARTAEEKENGVFIDAATFKERIGDKVTSEGVQLGLHTYSSLVPAEATNILSNPKWQKQICYDETTYTLRGKLTKFRTSIKTNEDASGFEVASAAVPWNNVHTRYILIDSEIIYVSSGTSSGFINVKRGQLGTTATVHEDGAEIRQLLGWYGMFQSQPLSELFYYIASETARAYNEGGFEMLYLDGLESFHRTTLCDTRAAYYIYSEFVRAVVSQCETPPIVEYSTFAPYLWGARGRGGAIDSARRSYKNFKTAHVSRQKQFLNYFYTATMGWLDYAPDRNKQYKDTTVRTMYRDDIDHAGSLAIAYNFSTVCEVFSLSAFNAPTRLADNYGYYQLYSELRKANYFSPEVREQIKNGNYEYKIIKQSDGSWAFREMRYLKNKIFDLDLASGECFNPFYIQKPFIRIENRYSSLGENAVTVKEFDETKSVSEFKGTHTIPIMNVSDKLAFKIRVYGNGSDSDAILLTLKGVVTGETGRNDMFIPLNFTGWRDIILIEANNDDYEGYSFDGISTGTTSYETYRAQTELDKLTSVTVSLCGECTGVKIDDLVATTIVDAPIKNPSVTVGSETISFNAELHSSDFIEYYPDEGKAYRNYYTPIYDDDGNWLRSEAHVEEITFEGSVTLPGGNFKYTYNATPLTEAPVRAQVVFGVAGDVIENPKTWTEPKVTLPENIEKVTLY